MMRATSGMPSRRGLNGKAGSDTSRLVNYTFGDLCDRLTVLALKIHHYAAAGKPIDHLVNERNTLLVQWQARNPSGKWFEALLEIAVVNGVLWTETDRLRVLAQWHGDRGQAELAQIAVTILRLNDRRAQLVDLIDQEVGDFRGSEKGGGA